MPMLGQMGSHGEDHYPLWQPESVTVSHLTVRFQVYLRSPGIAGLVVSHVFNPSTREEEAVGSL